MNNPKTSEDILAGVERIEANINAIINWNKKLETTVADPLINADKFKELLSNPWGKTLNG